MIDRLLVFMLVSLTTIACLAIIIGMICASIAVINDVRMMLQ